MRIEHKSIFSKVKDYKGNPITEFIKIQSFLNNKTCYYNDTIYTFLADNFKKCTLLRGNFIDLNNCLYEIMFKLNEHNAFEYDDLDEEIQNDIFDAFLTYCEVIAYVHGITWKYYVEPNELFENGNFDSDTFLQVLDLIKISLKSMNHDIKMINKKTLEMLAYKCNPEAEIIAEQSPNNLKEAIYFYLGTKQNDIKEKQNRLHMIIDLIEPLLKKYKKSTNLISKIEEYVQLIRHPEMKKKEPQYEWFYDETLFQDYLDQIFSLCLLVKEFDVANQITKDFEEKKKEINK